MQQRFNRRARSWIFEWISDVGLCLYAKGQFQVLQAWQIWLRKPILAPDCAAAETIWHHANVCQNGCHRHASLWFLCDVTSMCPGIRDISKTGHFHPCIGSGTNWLRVNCWCCTLQYFIWPAQEWNKMDQSRFHCSWLALLALSKGCVPSCFHHMCHGLTFSVSPIGAAVCSCQQAAFEVHLLSVGTKTASTNGASGSRLSSSTIPIGFGAFRTIQICQCTCWCKTGRKLYFTVASWLTLWGPLHLSLMGLLQCQSWDGGGLCTPPSWDTKLWCIQNQAEMFRKKIKFGAEAAWNLKQKPKQSWKLRLCSWEPSDLVNLSASKL